MSQQLRTLFRVALGLSVGAIGLWGTYALVRGLWRALVSVNPDLAVAVIAAATTIIASTLTVMVGRYYERKKEIEAHFRVEKIKIYDEFLRELFKVFHSESRANTTDRLVPFLREWQRKLILWGGSSVLRAYFRWMTRLKAGTPDADTVFLMDEFFRALRADIGHDSAGLPRGSFAHLIMRHSDLFLVEAAKNPKITLAEVAAKEKALYGEHEG